MDVNFYKILLGMLAFSNSYIIKAFTGKSNTKMFRDFAVIF